MRLKRLVNLAFVSVRHLSKVKMSANDAPAPPAVWTPPAKIEELYAATAGNQFAAINAPTAGPRVEQALPVGSAPFQLYSLATPNGK